MSTTAQSSGRHLSIGEVLAQLRDDFPDVTISKIRFLESQGLIDPERTPSGYRKFYGPDLERLRWILEQQRDHFLPLRVIKARLDAYGPTGAPPGIDTRPSEEPAPPEQVARPAPSAPPPPPVAARPALSVSRAPAPAPPPVRPMPSPPTTSQSDASQPDASPSVAPSPPRPAPATVPPEPEPLFDDFVDDAEEDHEGLGVIEAPDTEPGESGMTRAELLEMTGLTDLQLDALHEYGIVSALVGEGERALYDDEALTLAELAAGYNARGIEARHLKMYQHFAEREAAMYAQVLVQYVRQRNPKAREKLQEELEELARLGRRLRTAMLRRALRESLAE